MNIVVVCPKQLEKPIVVYTTAPIVVWLYMQQP